MTQGETMDFVKKKRGIPEERLKELESEFAIVFPDDYREFLRKYNGGKPVKDAFQWKGKSEKLTGSLVDWFLTGEKASKSGLDLYFHRYKGRMPDHLIPIAYDPGGNIICLSCQGKDNGTVYFWDHENEALVTGGKQPYFDNLRFVASSFTDFLEILTA